MVQNGPRIVRALNNRSFEFTDPLIEKHLPANSIIAKGLEPNEFGDECRELYVSSPAGAFRVEGVKANCGHVHVSEVTSLRPHIAVFLIKNILRLGGYGVATFSDYLNRVGEWEAAGAKCMYTTTGSRSGRQMAYFVIDLAAGRRKGEV